MDFRNKLYYFISEQLPDYIRNEYPQFTLFLETYYKFLETNGQAHFYLLNASAWADIDKTLELFLPEFKKQHAYDISDEALIRLRRLLKYIHDYYEAKGSENGVELFFRFMYDQNIEVAYPGDYVLRASDGKWNRKRILKLDTDVQEAGANPFELKNKIITLSYLENVAGVGKILRTVQTSCLNVIKQIEKNIYQLEVDISPNYRFPDLSPEIVIRNEEGEIVAGFDIDGDGEEELIPSLGNYDTHVYVIFNQKVHGVLTKQLVGVKQIIEPGANFRIDDSYLLSEQGVFGFYFAEEYCSNTNDDPALDFTYNPYVFETFTNSAVIRVEETTVRRSPNLPYMAEGEDFFLEDYVAIPVTPNSSGIDGIHIVDTGQRFLARDQSDQPITTFTINIAPKRPRDITGVGSLIEFRTGIVYVERGSYKNSSGFLSDINHLFDNGYYQPFSYIIRSPLPFRTWKELYTKSTHPAGMRVYSHTVFRDDVTFRATLDDDIAFKNYYFDILEPTEDIRFHVFKTLTGDIIDAQTYFAENYTLGGYTSGEEIGIVLTSSAPSLNLESGGELLLESGGKIVLESGEATTTTTTTDEPLSSGIEEIFLIEDTFVPGIYILGDVT